MGGRPIVPLLALGLGLAPLLAACSPCSMSSTVAGFDPACDQSVLRRYTTEARLAIPAEDMVLLAYLPYDITAGSRYGGSSGNPMTVVLEDWMAESRTTNLDLWTLDSQSATGELTITFEESGDFSGGVVKGDFAAVVERGD